MAVAPTTRLYLCRHGNPDNPLGLTGGWTDLPLSEQGRRQSERLA